MRPRRDGRDPNEIMSVAFVSASPHLLSGFRWASTDAPWGDLDDDGIEVPSDHGEWVSLAFQFGSRPSR